MGVRLVRDAQAEPAGLGRRATSASVPADLDFALVGAEEAAGDPEQCRLPGPVLPDECVDLARAAVDADVAESLDGCERLRDAAKGQRNGGSQARDSTWCFDLGPRSLPPRGTSA